MRCFMTELVETDMEDFWIVTVWPAVSPHPALPQCTALMNRTPVERDKGHCHSSALTLTLKLHAGVNFESQSKYQNHTKYHTDARQHLSVTYKCFMTFNNILNCTFKIHFSSSSSWIFPSFIDDTIARPPRLEVDLAPNNAWLTDKIDWLIE